MARRKNQSIAEAVSDTLGEEITPDLTQLVEQEPQVEAFLNSMEPAEIGVEVGGDAAAKGRNTKKDGGQPCQCGCGNLTRGGRFLPGHDARHKGRLLEQYDQGDKAASAEIIERGWATEESLAARADKTKGRATGKTDRTRARLAALEQQISTLMVKRNTLQAELAALEQAEE
jgi:hypothetical protein